LLYNIYRQIQFHSLEIPLPLKKPFLIYATKITPRLEYTVRLIFGQILGQEVRIVDDTVDLLGDELPWFNYSSQRFGSEPFIKADSLLFNDEVIMSPPDSAEDEGVTGFFPVSGDCLMRFDPLASAFYLVTRMEEYASGERDNHGRFQAKNSILHRAGLLGKPVVNLWALLLFKKLKDFYPFPELPEKAFSVRITIDVDNAWAYRGKGWIRTAGSILRDIGSRKWTSVTDRFAVMAGLKPDPYDTYAYLFKTLEGRREQVLFFFHVGNYGRYDRPVFWKNAAYKQLVREVASLFRVGIHPSYLSASEGDNRRVMMEKGRLEQITGSPITCSRQHYLRLDIPDTYRKLIHSGITEDYSMGYAEITGFRAGICTPFRFYDLKEEMETSLTVYPVPVMDVTLRNYMGLKAEDAAQTITKLRQEIQNAGGTLVVSWHNESVTDEGEWANYRSVFEQVITGNANDET
jgi:hypothetical protein